MSSLQPSELEVGDLIKVTRVWRVTRVSGDAVYGLDEKSDRHIGVNTSRGDTLKIELLHRPTPKPSVGDVITGETVLNTMWKRGTVLQNPGNPEYVFILTADGEWLNQLGKRFDFSVIEETAQYKTQYKVLHVGQ